MLPFTAIAADNNNSGTAAPPETTPPDVTANPEVTVNPEVTAGSEPEKKATHGNTTRPAKKPRPDPKLDLTLVKSGVAQSRNLLGQTAATVGVGLDSVFGSPDKNQPNESSIILRSGIRFADSENMTTINGLNFRADLPATSSKFQLFIRLDDEKEIGQTGNQAVANTPDDTPGTAQGSSVREAAEAPAPESDKASPASKGFLQADKAGLFVRYIYQAPDSAWQTTFDTGWQLNTSNFDTQAVSYLRTGRNYQLGAWQLRPVPVIFWTEDTGSGVGITLHSQRTLDSITTLQNSTGANYLYDEDTIYFSHGWQLIKAFSPDLRATYNLTLYTNDQVNEIVDEAQISATLRRRLDGQWLFFSVTPADTLKAESNYDSTFSITFQLEAKFGTQY